MKRALAVTILLFSLAASSQTITGKWKPVFFSMDTIMRADVRADTVFINEAAMAESFKTDNDPEMSKNMITMLFQALFKNIKEVEEEFLSDGSYRESNSRTKRMKSGKWSYDEKTKTLVKTIQPGTEGQNFLVSWKNSQMILTTELESSSGKKGKLEVVYERQQ